nr:reverse transcriptase domain-containing protein [Tanacetum cinerariifolium]
MWSLVENGVPAQTVANPTEAQKKAFDEAKLKDLKESMRQKYEGSTKVKRDQLQALRREFELLSMKDSTVVAKILQSLSPKFNYVVCSIEESNNLDTVTIDELHGSLLVHEQRMIGQQEDEQALKITTGSSFQGRGRGRGGSSRGSRRGRGRSLNTHVTVYLPQLIPCTSAIRNHFLTSLTLPTCLCPQNTAGEMVISHWMACKKPDQEKAQPNKRIAMIPLLKKHKGCTWNARVAIHCMRTRSNFDPSNSTATIPRRSNRRRILNIVEPEIRIITEIVSMADRTMEELLRAPTEGYGEAVVILEILAENFEIKTNLLQLVQANKFHGFERDNPHTHISNFKRMTATLKYRDVSNDAIKLMLFPYSLEGAARIWYEKEPPNSILTWDDLVNKSVNQFFPPSKTTHLKNEISRFTQRFEETFREAWDRFKEMLRACPHHGFSKLTQIDTDIVSKTDDRIDKLADQISNLVEIVNKQVIAPAKAVEKTCVTCGGAHAYYECVVISVKLYIFKTLKYGLKQPKTFSSKLSRDQTSNPTSSTNPTPKGRIHRSSKQKVENSNFEENPLPPEIPMAENQTLAQLLQEPTNGPARSPPLLLARGGCPDLARKEPPRSILTWDDLVSKFINQFFPPSKTTNLRNKITRFQQRFDESFSEAWDRFNNLLRACLHHGFSELHQLDTFYNALNVNDQDSLNSAAGGNFLDKMPPDCLKIIESKSKVRQTRAKAVVAKVNSNTSTPAVSSDVAELKDMVRALLLGKKNQYSAQTPSPTPAPIKAVEPNCVTCGGTHAYQNCPATSGNIYQDNIQEVRDTPGNTVTNPKEDLKGITTRSGVAYQGPTIPTPSKVAKQGTEVTKDQVQTLNSQSTAPVQPTVTQSESKTLVFEPVVAPVSAPMPNLKPSIPYPSRRDNERCLILNKLPKKLGDPGKFVIPCEFPGMDECLALADIDVSINLMPLFVWKGLSLPKLTPTCMTLKLADRMESKPVGIAKYVKVKVGVVHFPADFVVVDFEPDPRVPLILRRCFSKTSRALIDVHKGELTLLPLLLMIQLSPPTTSPTLTSFGDSDFLLFEEADAFLGLEDDPDSPKLDPFYYDPEGDILSLKAILNNVANYHEGNFLVKAYETPIGCTPYKLVYGKVCHLPVELEHKAYWALKQTNFDLSVAGDHRKIKLNELNELCDHAYENSLIYKEKRRESMTLRSKTAFSTVFPYGTVELSQANGPNFKVNGHRIKHYFGRDVPQLVVPDLQTFLLDQP